MEKVKSNKIIGLAKSEVIGFTPMYKKLEQKVILGGLSNATLLNYGRCIAKISLHFHVPFVALDEEQINGYLLFLLTILSLQSLTSNISIYQNYEG